VLWLLNLWLEAGALDPQTYFSRNGILHKGKQTLADLQLLLRDTANRSLDEYVNDRLAVSPTGLDQLAPFSYEDLITDDFTRETAKHHKRREVMMQFLKDGALLALSHRAAIAKLLGLKLLGAGGLAVTAAFVAPKILSSYRDYFHPQIGTLQGAPISPLLTNAFMTPFDAEIMEQGWRLIRYCDDFVIQCRSEEESRMALQAATEVLDKRKLRLHPDKTRIVHPAEISNFWVTGLQGLAA
jgi:hypothetical protein